MNLYPQDNGITVISAAPQEARDIADGLEAAYEALTTAAHALNDEKMAAPMLEQACRYQSLADRIRDEIDA